MKQKHPIGLNHFVRLWLPLLLLLLLLLTPQPIRAQEPNAFRVEPGQELLFDHVLDIGTLGVPSVIEDADGFLWFGSGRGEGLFRWDGYEITHYPPPVGTALGYMGLLA